MKHFLKLIFAKSKITFRELGSQFLLNDGCNQPKKKEKIKIYTFTAVRIKKQLSFKKLKYFVR